ncbi:MAG TPA: LuxR C-terminal-related transcriptional regulator [Pseudonocardiaceae bacterium]
MMVDQPTVVGGRMRDVADDVSTSKIGVPALPGWVISRPRLAARIDKGSRGPLTVVTGAPGAGKTVAVASWVASLADRGPTSRPGPVAWMTVDDGDTDPDVFWCYLREALRRIGMGLPIAGRPPSRADGVDHVGIAELASVLTRREQSVVLVLDDFCPPAGSALVTGLAYLLKLARPWLRLVIVSRRDLPLPLHRHRLTGDLTEIRSDDLAFTEREIDQLMAQHGVALRHESVRALRERTEGWAAGLRLAAMSMDGHPDPDEFVVQISSADHAIAGYLVEEVLDAQRPTVRRLLLTTSILDRVNAEIAVDLTAGTDGTEFSDIVGQNAFIRPLGQGWYRYHQMFRDVLRLRLQHENPGQTAALHRRAAAWFSARNLLTEAVQHAAAALDWHAACGLIVDRLAIGDLLGLRPAPRLSAALRRMPAAVASADLPAALVVAALARASGDGEASQAALHRGTVLLAGRGDAVTARLTVALLRLVHARNCHEAGIADAAAEVEELLGHVPQDLAGSRPDVRSLALAGRAVTEMWAGHWAPAAESFAAAYSAAAEAESTPLRLDCLAHGALVEAFRGRWGRAAELATQAAQQTSAQAGPSPRGVAALEVVRAWILLQRYQLAEARRVLDQAVPALLDPAHPLMAAVYVLVTAYVDIAEGQEHRGLETLRRMCTIASVPSWLVRRRVLAEADAHTGMGAAVAAWQAAVRAGGSHTPDGAVALARAQLSAGHPVSALSTLRPALTEAVAVRSDVRVAAWLLDAQSSYATGNPSRGRRSLDRALRLGDREQVRLPFAAFSPWLRSVLRCDQDLARQYLRLLQPLRIGIGSYSEPGETADPGPVMSRQLSDRELEVLQHLAQMRTSEEIAAEMYVSINTIKTHLKSIYRKLAVTRRGDAVRRAQQLDLLTATVVPAQRSEQAQLPGPPDGLAARRHTQLAIDQAGMALNGVHRDE